MTPVRLCNAPRCGNPATARGKCDEHRKAYERDRSAHRRADSHKSFYDTKRWKLTARHIKFQRPLCERCDNALSQEVHHDPPLHVLLETGRNPYDPAGLVALCKPCHSAVTLQERRAE
jgi:5-methylcytosine-specific restriction endonuclease McrA